MNEFPPPSSVRWKLRSGLVQQRTQGYLSLQLLVQGPSLWEGQDISISHPASSYLLLRLSSGQVWLRHGGLLFLLSPHSWDGGCTLGVTSLSVLGPDHLYLDCNSCVIHTERSKLRRPEATPLSISVQLLKAGVPLREKCPIVPTPSSRPVA